MGRTSLLMVMAFNIIFLVIGNDMGNISKAGLNNYLKYLEVTQAKIASESMANIILGKVCETPDSIATLSKTYNFVHATCNITSSAIDSFTYVFNIETKFNKMTSNSDIVLQRLPFSRYAMFSINDNIGYSDYTVIDGPLYAGGIISVSHKDYNPWDARATFLDEVTISGDSITNRGAGNFKYPPKVKAEKQKMPQDLSAVTNAAKEGGKFFENKEIYIEFKSNGSVDVYESTYDKPWQGTKTSYSSVSDFTSNGVVAVDKGNIHVKGVLDGAVTLCATGKGDKVTRNGEDNFRELGNVYIDSSVVYKNPPKSMYKPDGDNNSDDFLGLVAENDVMISEFYNHTEKWGTSKGAAETDIAKRDKYKQNVDIDIHASIFCKDGGFRAENKTTEHNRTEAPCKVVNGSTNYYEKRDYGRKQTIFLVGGIQQQNRRNVGDKDDGYDKAYSYDPRLRTLSPPGYPKILKYNVISWRDQVKWESGYWDEY